MPDQSSVTKSEESALVDRVAPRWHTAMLVAWIVCVNAIGFVLSRDHVPIDFAKSGASKILSAYLPAIAAEWMVLAFAVFVPRPRGVLAQLMGHKWSARNRWPIDAACALALIAFIVGFELISARFLHVTQNPAIVTLLPRTISEHVVWIFVAMTAGFCEEVVYRGYLRTQLEVLTRSAWIGITLQALLFGIAHAEQGAFVMLRFAIYGIAFGIVARGRNGLLACIVAHASIDLAAGFVSG